MTESHSRPTIDNARIRILCALARVCNPAAFAEGERQGEVGLRIRCLVLGANIDTYRKYATALRRFMLGRYVFELNGTVYHIEIERVVALSQPEAGDLYVRRMVPVPAPGFERMSYIGCDIGTWTWDVLLYINGQLDEDRSRAVTVGVGNVRERLRELLLTKYPFLPIMTRELEFLLLDPSPSIVFNGARSGVLDLVTSARGQVWREGLAQLAPTLRGVSLDYAFFWGGGAAVFRPTITELYATQGSYCIVDHPHMTVAWGYYFRGEEVVGIDQQPRRTPRRQAPALRG